MYISGLVLALVEAFSSVGGASYDQSLQFSILVGTAK